MCADFVVLWCHGMCYACEVQCTCSARVLIVKCYGADYAVLWCCIYELVLWCSVFEVHVML